MSEEPVKYDREAHTKRLVAVARKRADSDELEYEISPAWVADTLEEARGEA